MSTNATRRDTATPAAADGVVTDPFLPDSGQLADLGNMPDGYGHYAKLVTPAGGLALPGGYLKWYEIHREDADIPPDTREQARDFLRAEASAGRLDLRDELGFVLLHRCGEDFYFLAPCTWRNQNEMWQTVYQRSGDGPFELSAPDGDHQPVQCVWELGATGHERLAWSRYLRSQRDETAKRAYLADVFSGEV
jgi:hypothetical protein